jgi:DNA repair exonuclease SbcCD ATPase subunit
VTSVIDKLPELHIIGLEVENLKRIISVRIKPKSNVVVISGKNGQGKSSTLDAIWWALAGKGNISSVPIRKGQNEATIKLDLGEIVVTRKFRRDLDGETTTGVVVSAKNGARFPSPQDMLNELLGKLCMDPNQFARMGSTPEGKRQQLKQLQVFVEGYDFDGQDRLNKTDYERRADVNKLRDQSQAAAELVSVPEEAPDEEVDEAALVAELEEAGKKNQINERRRQGRVAAELGLKQQCERLEKINPEMEGMVAEIQANCDENVRILEEQIKRAREMAAIKISETRQIAEREHAAVTTEIQRIEKQFDEADDIPADTDTAAIRDNIAKAKRLNEMARRKAERERHIKVRDQYAAESDSLTARMNARQAAKRAAIAASKLPVPGLDFGVDEILLNGLPFDQASDAERLRTSIAIGIAQNPKLRVMRIREGSLLDSEGMKIVEEMAAEGRMQIWLEKVSDGNADGMSIVIEEGRVKDEAA